MALLKKIVTIGDGACGKTCLLTTFSHNQFPETHVPTIFDTYSKTIEVDDITVDLALWDTAGEEDYDRLRPLSYPRTNVVLICFSIDNPDSLQNVKERWAPEAKHFLPYVPILLVGTKLDLRSDPDVVSYLKEKKTHPVTYQEGERVARKIGAAKYMECSSKLLLGVKPIFEEAARISMTTKKASGWWSNCKLL